MRKISSKQDAIDRLAETLRAKMERLDPSSEKEWGELPEREKEFFRECVKAVLREPSLVAVALADP
jgi:hypothetical protein